MPLAACLEAVTINGSTRASTRSATTATAGCLWLPCLVYPATEHVRGASSSVSPRPTTRQKLPQKQIVHVASFPPANAVLCCAYRDDVIGRISRCLSVMTQQQHGTHYCRIVTFYSLDCSPQSWHQGQTQKKNVLEKKFAAKHILRTYLVVPGVTTEISAFQIGLEFERWVSRSRAWREAAHAISETT